MNIENEVIYSLLMVMYNINKKIDKAKLKSLFKYIFLKFITITPINTKDKYFINFWEEKEENFILNYSFPIITSVFRMILKEYKKKGIQTTFNRLYRSRGRLHIGTFNLFVFRIRRKAFFGRIKNF